VTTALRRITDLPDFFALVEDGWHLDLLDTGCTLMQNPGLGLLRASRDVVVAFRYHDVRELAVTRDAGNMPIDVLAGQSTRREVGSGAGTPAPEPPGHEHAFFRMLADQAFTHNPPLHKLTRRMLSRQILRHNLQRLEPLAAQISSSLLDGIAGRGEIDFAAEVARPFVARFWGGVIGLSSDECAEVAALMRDLDLIFGLQRGPGDSEVIDRAAERYVEVVTRCVERCLAAGDNEFVEEMAADLAAIDAPGKPESLGSYVAANLFDGFHTAGVAISNALYVLLAAGRYDDMLRDPSLVPKAFGEVLRMAPPLLLTHRYALADIVHDGVLLPAGTAIAMLWGSPGFDPAVFADPWEFRWDRDPRVLFTFGGGPHLCPGRTAAHVLVEHCLRAVVEHDIHWQLADGHAYQWQPASAMRELADFPVEVRRAGTGRSCAQEIPARLMTATRSP
jgi:cytochrome P450